MFSLFSLSERFLLFFSQEEARARPACVAPKEKHKKCKDKVLIGWQV